MKEDVDWNVLKGMKEEELVDDEFIKLMAGGRLCSDCGGDLGFSSCPTCGEMVSGCMDCHEEQHAYQGQYNGSMNE